MNRIGRHLRRLCMHGTTARFRVAVALVFLLSSMTMVAISVPARAVTEVALVVSNFRYCVQDPCQFPGNEAYRRGPDGPIEDTDDPSTFVDVDPGQTVTWTYHDTGFCDPDPLFCDGHEVRFEAEGGGDRVGFMLARQGPSTVGYRVPTTTAPGTVLRYYCNVQGHWQFGLTGALRVTG